MIFSAERGSSHDSMAKHYSLCPGEEKKNNNKKNPAASGIQGAPENNRVDD